MGYRNSKKRNFFLPENGKVKIIISSIDDELVWDCENNFENGDHSVEWDMIKEKSTIHKSAYFSGTEFFNEGMFKIKFQIGEIIIND